MGSKESNDLSIRVTSFYMKIVGFWLATDYAEERRRTFAMIYTVVALIIAILVEVRDLHFTWGNTSESVYIICNIINVIVVLFKIFVSFIHKKELLSLVQYAKTNFWHSNYDPYEQMVMDTCKRTCTLLVCIFSSFAQATVISYMIRPILANIGTNASERVLPFNCWTDVLSVTPYFEIAFVLQVLILYLVGVCYLCFDNFLCLLNLHTAAQFHILQYRFSNMCNLNNREQSYKISEKSLFGTSKYATFRNMIQQHQALIEYCNRLESVFSVLILGQVLFFSLLMCLDGYLILMNDAPRARRITFAIHITGCMCQLLMFTYSCDCLIRESMNIANAGYGSSWSLLPMDKDGRMLRKDMVLVILRSSLPCCLTASGFFPVSLETYTGILSTAVSYFTLLRNQVTV